jgi:pyrroline-5-carboxylate reductase
MTHTLGILGGGNMAEAIVKAILDRRVLSASQLIVSDPQQPRRRLFESMGVAATDRNADVIAGSEQVMLAVKPQMLPALADDLKRIDAERQVVVSIMAGITCRKLAATAAQPLRIIRVMPNTPLMVGRGMSGLALGPDAKAGDEALSLRIFQAAGEAVVVAESDLDALTAVSGSGPAYLFYLAEAMNQAAIELNLAPQAASLLVRQTLLGAAELLTRSGEDPAALRKKVTSPGGTTQAAVEHMESHDVRRHIAQAISRAAQRSRELGQ